jgi:hypothetical protein
MTLWMSSTTKLLIVLQILVHIYETANETANGPYCLSWKFILNQLVHISWLISFELDELYNLWFFLKRTSTTLVKTYRNYIKSVLSTELANLKSNNLSDYDWTWRGTPLNYWTERGPKYQLRLSNAHKYYHLW